MLTEDQARRMDEAKAAGRFRQSPMYPVLKDIFSTFRQKAIEDIEDSPTASASLPAVRMLHAVNDLMRHVETELEDRWNQLEQVALETGANYDELKFRRMIVDE